MIKYNNSNINDWNFGSDNIAKAYYGVTTSGSSRLPSGYTEVEYIRNSNYNAYINTGVILFDNMQNTYTVTTRLTSEFHSNLSCATIINSEKPVSPYNGLGYRYKCSPTVDQLEFFGGNPNYSSSVVDNGDGTRTVSFQSTGASNFTTDAPLTFCCAFSDTAYTITHRFADATIYSATIVKNGETIRDFVPAKRDSDSVYGLYDLINGEFYSSPNGNNFSGGSAVTPSSSTTVGNVVYQKITNGSTPPTPIDYANEYLTLVAQTDGVTIGLSNASSNVFQYSLDSGSTWNNLSNNQTTPSINNGDKIMFKASSLSVATETGIGRILPSASASVEGNIMSLIYGDNFSGQTEIPNNYQLRKLFSGATNITSAENMILPATSLKQQCYSQMFKGCTSLTKTPKTVGSSAMTWSGSYCMSNMFSDCTSLTHVSSTLLPALNLGTQCYWYMFESDTSLLESPILPATTLANQCYQGLFNGCTNLNTITCLAAGPSNTNYWVTDVQTTSGTFYKNPTATWSRGDNAVPINWTIVDYSG